MKASICSHINTCLYPCVYASVSDLFMNPGFNVCVYRRIGASLHHGFGVANPSVRQCIGISLDHSVIAPTVSLMHASRYTGTNASMYRGRQASTYHTRRCGYVNESKYRDINGYLNQGIKVSRHRGFNASMHRGAQACRTRLSADTGDGQ